MQSLKTIIFLVINEENPSIYQLLLMIVYKAEIAEHLKNII